MCIKNKLDKLNQSLSHWPPSAFSAERLNFGQIDGQSDGAREAPACSGNKAAISVQLRLASLKDRPNGASYNAWLVASSSRECACELFPAVHGTARLRLAMDRVLISNGRFQAKRSCSLMTEGAL